METPRDRPGHPPPVPPAANDGEPKFGRLLLVLLAAVLLVIAITLVSEAIYS